MSCGTGACCPREGGPGGPHNIRPDPSFLQNDNLGRDRAPRRRTYFNQTVHEISVRLQYPDLISFREAVLAIVVLYTMYRGVFAGMKVYSILFERDISIMCRGVSAMGCVWWVLTRYLFPVFIGWGSETVPWAILAAVFTFFGEEVLRKLKTKK
ncbi:hypothetical protein QBC43DRAFT_312715 [Cladorrhinum sp. PSN259]|nr:hypothetical protein QBC43DRAFT_312715 [Cladorrhinum sp. PSN259]